MTTAGRRQRLGLSLAALWLAAPSLAADDRFAVSATREPLSAREVERPLHLPRGWVELALGWEHQAIRGTWSANGAPVAADGPVYDHETLTARYGVARGVELWWAWAAHQARLPGGPLEFSVGDPRLGARVSVLDREPNRTSVVLEAAYKAPLGEASRGVMVDDVLVTDGFVFSSGTSDLGAGLAARQQLGALAIGARGAYTYRFPAPVAYIGAEQGGTWIRPGATLRGEADAVLQLGPVALRGVGAVERRGTTAAGGQPPSPGEEPEPELVELPGTDGFNADVGGGVIAQASRGVDVELYLRRAVAGEDNALAAVPALHPSWGTVWGARIAVRR